MVFINVLYLPVKKEEKKVQTREYKYKKILRQCSILAINFWSVTYFGVFNFGTSYLGAKIGQNKIMTKISRFTVTYQLRKIQVNLHLIISSIF